MRKHVEQVEKENKKLKEENIFLKRTFNFMFAKQEKGSEAV